MTRAQRICAKRAQKREPSGHTFGVYQLQNQGGSRPSSPAQDSCGGFYFTFVRPRATRAERSFSLAGDQVE